MRKLTNLGTLLLTAIAAVAIAMLAGGCATTSQTPANQPRIEADIPPYWHGRIEPAEIQLTKDGALLQLIKVSIRDYGEKYENTDLTLQAGMTSLDASQVILESMQADLGLRNLQILDNRPTTVAGHPGFRLEITFKNENNLTVHEIIYVALTPDNYLVALCRAPHRHYMETISGDFEQLVATLRIVPPEPAAADEAG